MRKERFLRHFFGCERQRSAAVRPGHQHRHAVARPRGGTDHRARATDLERGIALAFDLLLAGGTVIDGTRRRGPSRRCRHLQRPHRRHRRSLAARGRAARVDCTGQVVCPGFIDLHAHSDLTLLANPRAESKVRMGVTSECNGQCGMGVFPVRAEDRQALRATCSFIEAPT